MPKRPFYKVSSKTTPTDGISLRFIPTKKDKYSPTLNVPLKNFKRFMLFANVKKK